MVPAKKKKKGKVGALLWPEGKKEKGQTRHGKVTFKKGS